LIGEHVGVGEARFNVVELTFESFQTIKHRSQARCANRRSQL
jgi:hypothetical protein